MFNFPGDSLIGKTNLKEENIELTFGTVKALRCGEKLLSDSRFAFSNYEILISSLGLPEYEEKIRPNFFTSPPSYLFLLRPAN